jgi:hypothetical protein
MQSKFGARAIAKPLNLAEWLRSGVLGECDDKGCTFERGTPADG